MVIDADNVIGRPSPNSYYYAVGKMNPLLLPSAYLNRKADRAL